MLINFFASKALLSNRLTKVFQDFIRSSRAVGVLLLCCTAFSLLFANLPGAASYRVFWHQPMNIEVPVGHLPHTWLLWVNDGLMVLFFFLVGLEIKRELWEGELSSFKRSILPVGAALGGMLFPAIIYLIFNYHTPYHHGWGIPMATDIAFSLGILSLLGKRIPNSLKIFLAALAIMDDLGAILVIAVFYTEEIHFLYLAAAFVMVLIMVGLNLMRVKRIAIYLLPSLILWYCMLNSGVHATIAGVLAAFSLPLSVFEKLERALHVPVNFIVLPLFALANTAIELPASVGHELFSSLGWGIMLGLALGKPLGIFLTSYLLVKTKLARLPSLVRWKHIAGVGILAGIGFTMSIFITMLAFDMDDWQLIAKLSIMISSLVSGLIGYFYLRYTEPRIRSKK
ncbi:Na+/H+ antiporter NhaA [Thermoflavifilum thermophilum]|uniref:Na(+)/H(+) antiporter NhaA n=1 Tax=Thermoflavifilum thermophilum TaxID=1393122 RepID=A0A1I7NHW5_9BACT|nr:Na+/H+ antiporter NhaA [Thermoflavifilum thermophilum]SFV34265.1 Na+:H+ antiporter, NhaA family [Thermoflavifilum thermophilum]